MDELRNAYEAHRQGASWSQKKYMDFLDRHRDLKKLGTTRETEFAAARRRYDSLKAELGPNEFKKLQDAFRKGEKLDNPKHQEIIKSYFEREKAYKSASEEMKKADIHKKLLESDEALNQHGWRKDIAKANDNLLDAETKIWDAQKGVRVANESLHGVNEMRSALEMEMMQKADAFVEHADKMRVAAGYMQKGGFYSGAIWVISGGNLNPIEQVRYAGKGAEKVAEGAGYVGKELFFTDHGRDALDVIIERRVSRLKRQKRLDNEINAAKEKGKNKVQVYAENWEDPDVQEVAKKRGLFEKVQKLVDTGKVEFKENVAKIEVAAGDAAQKAKQKLSS